MTNYSHKRLKDALFGAISNNDLVRGVLNTLSGSEVPNDRLPQLELACHRCVFC